ncbi:phosphate ABC transporter substrate-binding protein PstS [Actinosynnema sp. NPDC047251]|uniref:ABC-type phosphate transporter,substrate-binding lipoprotein n=1 Tax=Saccharothrix espanaensis (strain ATCC 51144 / DSM 44229 / JCM 9112 / NBRC 15066 / NRRL 15764) TaxID=1179773 RepID=K0JRL9_SACES|nr:phosphate ABC transporter substrate-binding protein PstS [Saccharothrix espanaensis]CCH28431.1 ABC-type phosphate transporter,substrate-binding lipoprotein [Saccharothrix espanaensis DSM 44229]
MTRPILAVLAVLGLLLGSTPSALAAQNYTPISGAGSTWSYNALDQWRKNVVQYGMRISFSGTGSTDGRNQFRSGQVDFAVSEIPFGLKDGDKVEPSPDKDSFAYMPIVAGGTSLMYNLKIGGKRVTNLRLSGEVVTKMFTGAITSWADPAIARDNPGLKLPNRKVVPVVRSDGSGTTAQFTTWMASRHPAVWDDYCRRAQRATPCGFTSNYPLISPVVGQNGSLGVANYVRQEGSEGSITYVEYSYARNARFPVAKLLNTKGYYVEPKASAVAVALLKARIRDDLTQVLDDVYTNDDARSYPMSSYSYMILPVKETGKFNGDKGRTLSDFAYYFLCEGQQQADRLGFSPLPINLVRAGMDQVARVPGTTKQNKDLGKCNNPTFSADGSNTLATNAPQPPDCDKQGPAQCAEGTGGATENTESGGDDPADEAAAEQPGTEAAAAQTTGTEAPAEQAAVADEPANARTKSVQGASAVPVSVDIREDDTVLLISVAAVLLAALVVGPPLVARHLRRRETTR